MQRPCPAALTVAAATCAVAAADVRFHRRGERLVTDVLRTPVALAALLVLVAHVLDVLGRFDPFRAVARLIPPTPKEGGSRKLRREGN